MRQLLFKAAQTASAKHVRTRVSTDTVALSQKPEMLPSAPSSGEPDQPEPQRTFGAIATVESARLLRSAAHSPKEVVEDLPRNPLVQPTYQTAAEGFVPDAPITPPNLQERWDDMLHEMEQVTDDFNARSWFAKDDADDKAREKQVPISPFAA